MGGLMCESKGYENLLILLNIWYASFNLFIFKLKQLKLTKAFCPIDCIQGFLFFRPLFFSNNFPFPILYLTCINMGSAFQLPLDYYYFSPL